MHWIKKGKKALYQKQGLSDLFICVSSLLFLFLAKRQFGNIKTYILAGIIMVINNLTGLSVSLPLILKVLKWYPRSMGVESDSE